MEQVQNRSAAPRAPNHPVASRAKPPRRHRMVGMRGMGQREQHVDVQQVLHGESASAFSITDKATGFFPGAKGRTSKPLTGSRTRPGNRASVVVFRRLDTRRGLADFFDLVSVGIRKIKA